MRFLFFILVIFLIMVIFSHPTLLGILILISVIVTAIYQLFISKKNKEINEAIRIVTNKNKNKSNTRESILIGAGSTVFSLYDIYASTSNHEEVLDIIGQRFPYAVKDYTSIDWYKKINTMIDNNTIDSYVNAFAGQKAENLTVDYFEEKGLHAELFSSRTHENDDVRVYEKDGSYKDYSVKTMDSVGNFNQEVLNHPESTHYVVNQELYDDLENDGFLEEYASKGITIIKGNFSNIELREEGLSAFEDISEAGDIIDNIPIVASALLGYKTIKNYKLYKKGEQSSNEFRVNILRDTVKVGTSGVTAGIGAFICSALGFGLVTSGIGVIVSVYSGKRVINWIGDRIKWGDVYQAQSHFGTMNKNKLVEVYSNSAANKLFNLNELEKELKQERELIKKYEGNFDPFSDKFVTISAILCKLHIEQLNNKIYQIKEALNHTRAELLELSNQVAQKITNNIVEKKQVQMKVYGEIFLADNQLFNNITLDQESEVLRRKYRLNKEKNPNYPTRLPVESTEIFAGLAIRSYNQISKTTFKEYPIFEKKTWLILGVLLIIAFCLIFPPLAEGFLSLISILPLGIIMAIIIKEKFKRSSGI